MKKRHVFESVVNKMKKKAREAFSDRVRKNERTERKTLNGRRRQIMRRKEGKKAYAAPFIPGSCCIELTLGLWFTLETPKKR